MSKSIWDAHTVLRRELAQQLVERTRAQRLNLAGPNGLLAGPAPTSRCPHYGLGLLRARRVVLGRLRLELVGDEFLVADDPGIVARLDGVGLALASLGLSPVVMSNVDPA